MSRPMMIPSLMAWLAVCAFWFFATRSFHPSLALAVIVTTSLIVAYGAAAYINHLILVPGSGHQDDTGRTFLGTP